MFAIPFFCQCRFESERTEIASVSIQSAASVLHLFKIISIVDKNLTTLDAERWGQRWRAAAPGHMAEGAEGIIVKALKLFLNPATNRR